MRRGERLCCFVAVVASLFSCSTLPDYAAPKGAVVDPDSVDMSDVIAYRTLTRADFKGANPPEWFASYADRVGAATCCHILTAPDAAFMTRSVTAKDGTTRYEATPHQLRFLAQMDRRCSWWNPKDLGLPQAYILEHEQIHFALCELEARRLNAALPEIEVKLRATAASAQAAGSLVQEQLEEQLRERMSSILSRSRDFDEDTSMGHEPEAQRRWLAVVRAELAATGD